MGKNENLKIYVSLTLSLVLLLVGIITFLSQVPFGSFLGIPLTIIGTIFGILTFDKINQLTLEDEE